jgi:hypothetical protein
MTKLSGNTLLLNNEQQNAAGHKPIRAFPMPEYHPASTKSVKPKRIRIDPMMVKTPPTTARASAIDHRRVSSLRRLCQHQVYTRLWYL